MAANSTTVEWTTSDNLVSYNDAIRIMEDRVKLVGAGSAAEMVWLVEHPPLYTAGTSAKPSDLADPGRFPTFNAGRGGQWTYHGPGQQIGYVMLNLSRDHGPLPSRDTHAYVAALEAWLIDALADFDVQAGRRRGRVGVWVVNPHTGLDEKIAAIGVRITRWITWHGVSLNVAPTLEHFSGIVPCGLPEFGVTSLAALGISASMADVRLSLKRHWSTHFG